MYITERDNSMFRHIEENGSLSLINAANLFFYGHKDNASRRLNQLVKAKKLKSYRTEYDFLSHQEKIFILPGMKKVKEHELLRENFKALLELQFENDDEEYVCEDSISLTFPFMYTEDKKFHKFMKPDYIVKYIYKGIQITIILEIDYTHYTSLDKQQTMLDKKEQIEDILYKNNLYSKHWYIVIASNKEQDHLPGIIYTDLFFTNLFASIHKYKIHN